MGHLERGGVWVRLGDGGERRNHIEPRAEEDLLGVKYDIVQPDGSCQYCELLPSPRNTG